MVKRREMRGRRSYLVTARPPLGLIASPAKTSGGILFSDGERTASSRLEKGARGGSEERQIYSRDALNVLF